MEAIAQHDFIPSDDLEAHELGFKKGDKLLILNYGDPVQWYEASMNGQCGLVPCNYIEVISPSWYFGRIARLEAEQLLQGNKYEGAFLVRLSESSPTEFSLSVKCGNSVQHFRILKNSEHKYFLWSTTFDSLNQLVEHYRKETVSRTSKILLKDMNHENQFVVKALYDFDPSKDGQEGDSELEFKRGEYITVIDDSDENWWGGNIGERTGYFPKSYVQPYINENFHPI